MCPLLKCNQNAPVLKGQFKKNYKQMNKFFFFFSKFLNEAIKGEEITCLVSNRVFQEIFKSGFVFEY